jgi:hypothetical protein
MNTLFFTVVMCAATLPNHFSSKELQNCIEERKACVSSALDGKNVTDNNVIKLAGNCFAVRKIE